MLTTEAPHVALALISPEIPRLVNFILFVGILIYFLRKPIAQFLRQRVEKLRKDLERAEAERVAARGKLHELESRLSRLDEEIVSLKSQAAAEAQAEDARLQAGAEAEAEKLRAMARRDIGAATEAAKSELKTYAAAQAVELAKEIARREMKEDDHHRLVQQFAKNLGEVRQ